MNTFIEVEEAKKFYEQAIKNAEVAIEATIEEDCKLKKFKEDLRKNTRYEALVVIYPHCSRIGIIGEKVGDDFKNYVEIGLNGTTINEENIHDFPFMKEYIKRLEKITSKYFGRDEL